MKGKLWSIILAGLLLILSAAGCRQQDADVTPTPPVVPVVTDVDGGSGLPEDVYPAPAADSVNAVNDAYPAPAADVDGAVTDMYPAPGTEAPVQTPEPPVVDDQPEQIVTAEPIATETAVAIAPLPEATAEMPVVSNSTFTVGSTVQHTVVRGDWLLQVARCYGTTFEALRNANYLPYPDYIVPGTILTVPNVGSAGPVIGPPCVTEYTVQEGDTWDSLALRYGTSAAILQRANPGALTAGRVIFVPATP